MLNKIRDELRPLLEKTGYVFSKTGLSANFWSAVGLCFAFLSGIVYGIGLEFSLIVGGVLLLVSGFFDIIDGQVARFTKSSSKRGAFLDSNLDKIAEVAIFLGILVGGYTEDYLVFLAITLSLLVSYSRSRAESLGVSLQGVGIGERAERLLVLSIVGMAGFMEYAVMIVCVIAAITLVQRLVATHKMLGKT